MNNQTRYQAVESEGLPNECVLCADDSGTCNIFKAWVFFLLHFVACILLFVIMTNRVDGHTFKTGSPPSLVTSDLYQIQVTGLISFALVIIRLLVCSCSALLAWRTIFILLDKEMITLTELAHLAYYHFPIIPRGGSSFQLFWSCWAVAVVVLLWPPGFAAPVANSSVAWIPSTRSSNTPASFSIGTVSKSSDWGALVEPEMRTRVVVNAALMADKNPVYAFNSTQLLLRRYFSSTQKITANSTINITVPYFDVRLSWIDPASDNRSQHAGDPVYSDVANLMSGVRNYGSVAVLRNNKWNSTEATPRAAGIFSGTKLVSIQVNTLRIEEELDGVAPNINTTCPTRSPMFGPLPEVSQHGKDWYVIGKWTAKDCFLVAEASITAGKYKGTDCEVSPTDANDYVATCNFKSSPGVVEEDWISGLALDFMSETMKNIVMLDVTHPWMQNNLAKYTTGTLTLAYHAAWSALMNRLGNASEPTTARIAESVVLATVNYTRMWIWLAMNAMLTTSALMVAVAQTVRKTRTVRDTNMVALAMDLSEVMHSAHASELSGAVSLSKENHRVERLKWTDDYGKGENHTCRHRVVFAESNVNVQ
ncbi:hypothetical protein MMC31_006024 [Peltigera leucophlebia]|nr:hypothetical protein [Peltigera leucophlebia]